MSGDFYKVCIYLKKYSARREYLPSYKYIIELDCVDFV